jgi:inorganic pyrophosphatase
MIQHPWHEVPSGFDPESGRVHALIEISTGMRTKYEVDKASGLLKLDRILYSSIAYPANYGFIPKSMGIDGDPLDIMILCKEKIQPLCLVPARIIGVMRMVDQGQTDDKILAVPVNDPATRAMTDVVHLEEYQRMELREFFESYTKLEGKSVQVPDFQDKSVALSLVKEAIELYSATYPAAHQ